ncbi:MAG: hypothetical protein H7A37_00970 [Chlamydiales bacterium]|nr:hypothetical protein [Chlamydiia bacterium]MCP5506865.1 hypothetical protein [Chlamydiales bacterium]
MPRVIPRRELNEQHDIHERKKVCRMAQVAAIVAALVMNSIMLAAFFTVPVFGAVLLPLDILCTVLAYDTVVAGNNYINILDSPSANIVREMVMLFKGDDRLYNGTLLMRQLVPIFATG